MRDEDLVDLDNFGEEHKSSDDEVHINTAPYRLPTFLTPFELGTTNLQEPPKMTIHFRYTDFSEVFNPEEHKYWRKPWTRHFEEFFNPGEEEPNSTRGKNYWPCLMIPLTPHLPPAFARESHPLLVESTPGRNMHHLQGMGTQGILLLVV